MGSTTELEGEKKESENLKIERQTLSRLNDRGKTDLQKSKEYSLRDMWDL